MFKFRWLSFLWAARLANSFPNDFQPLLPGLEMKYAIEEAEKCGANISLAGMAYTESTIQALKNETRLNFLQFLWRWYYSNRKIRFWKWEWLDEISTMTVNGGENYAEIIDDYRVSWWVKLFEKTAPLQKEHMVDAIDQKIFRTLYKETDGKTLVAVVNQWHMPGIEAHWRHTTGTEIQEEPINPIGDMPINEIQEAGLVNDMMRRHYALVGNTEPAGSYDYILHYHLVAQEYERHRHAFFDSYKDPHLEHSLFRKENENVEYLPYSFDSAHH